jgi:hypothetical protein
VARRIVSISPPPGPIGLDPVALLFGLAACRKPVAELALADAVAVEQGIGDVGDESLPLRARSVQAWRALDEFERDLADARPDSGVVSSALVSPDLARYAYEGEPPFCEKMRKSAAR